MHDRPMNTLHERWLSFCGSQLINDRTSGTPSLCCPADRLVESSTIERCSGNERRAEVELLAYCERQESWTYIAYSPSDSALFIGGSTLVCLTLNA